MDQLDGIEREIGGPVELSIIWLHGLGADASDFLPIVNELELPTGVRFVFPNAPIRPVTINGGMPMRAWYDIRGFNADAPQDEAGLAASVQIVERLIERETLRGLERQQVLLAGFSQGGAVVLHAGLGTAEPIGGIIGLSTYLPCSASLLTKPLATTTPVFLAHGTHDPVLPLALGEWTRQFLKAQGVAVEWSVYPMGHEVCFDEIRQLSRWLAGCASR